MQHRLAQLAAWSLAGLIVLCLYWEICGAPLRPGGSWLVLKVFPLFLPLRGILHRRRYTFQWSSMLILAYLAEGLVRAATEAGASRWLAAAEVLLSLCFFVCAVFYARRTRPA